MTTRAARRAAALPETDPRRQAFDMARIALRELGRPETELTELAERCGMDMSMVEPYVPYGGATSWDELTTYLRGETRRSEYDQLNYQLQTIMNNVLQARDMTDADRAAAIGAVATGFAERAAAIPGRADAEVAEEMGLDDPDELDEINEGEADDTPRPTGSWWKRHRKVSAKDAPAPMADATSSFIAFREGPTWRWFAAYSNRYYDNLKEVFPEASHQRFLDWADADPGSRYPELWDWHTPVGVGTFGLKEAGKLGMGRADFLDYQDGIALAGGYFYPEFADAAETLSKTQNLGTSHGFGFAPWDFNTKDGSYENHLTFEISPLPRQRAANFGTTFLADLGLKEDTMQFRADRRAFLVGIHGEIKVKAMEKALGEHAQGLKEAGIDFKDVDFAAALATPAPAAAAPATSTPAAAVETPAAPAAASSELVAAMREAMAPVTTAIETLTTRLTAVEQRDGPAAVDAQVAAMIRPRIQAPAETPSTSSSNIIRGNSAMVIRAKDGAEATPTLIPPHLQRYARGLGFEAVAADTEPAVPNAPASEAAAAAATA